MFYGAVSTQCNMACDCDVVIQSDLAATIAAAQLKSMRVATKRAIRVASLERHEISSHRQFCCLVNILSRLTEKTNMKAQRFGHIWRNPPMTGWQRPAMRKALPCFEVSWYITSSIDMGTFCSRDPFQHSTFRRVWTTWNNYLAVKRISGHILH